jgi:hypothetical protein
LLNLPEKISQTHLIDNDDCADVKQQIPYSYT